VAVIPAAHGQAFEGLIHIGDFSVLTDQVAEQELFRAHEVAHLWWGHRVGWRSYRDQWLSEGFAEYSAMMFVEANLDKGPKYFDEMLAAFSDELTGSIGSTFSQFSRPGVPLLNMQAADHIGPIGHGRRSFVGEAPTAYYSQIYKKGALVLHMLRMLLRTTTGSDERFFEILQTFAERYAGRFATTADFQAVVEEINSNDWQWFFDLWVYGAEIPTYLWSYDVVAAETGYILRLQVEQRNVSPGFKMAVPVRAEFGDGREETLLAFVDQAARDFEFPLDEKPRKVIFNPDSAVLAKTKKK
jgi:aminopeptidase N